MMSDKTRDIEAASLIEEVEEEKKNRHGLVIGIDEYQNEKLNLNYAAKDAQEIYELMTDSECGMFPEENLKLLLNEEATERNIKKAFSRARREVGENDTFWLYYAGHGAPEGRKTYWLPHDAEANDLWATGISNSEIKEFMEILAAERKVLFLDCCYAVATTMREDSTRSSLDGEELIEDFDATGTVTIASSDTDERSVELSEYEQGAFTYYLKKGLKGEADFEEDGVVTLKELWDYLPEKVREAARKAGSPQTPVLKGEIRSGFPLTINSSKYRKTKEAEKLIKDNTGLGKDRLDTEEGKYLLALIKKDKKSMKKEETRLYEVLMSQVEEEEFKVSILEGLIENIRQGQHKKDKSEKKRKFKVMMNTKGKGEVRPEPGIHKYPRDEKIKLRASPEEGWEFVGWQGDIPDFNRKELAVTVDENMEIKAVFERQECVLDISVNNPEGGVVIPEPGKYKYKTGEEVKIKARPKKGWKFKSWRGDVKNSGSQNTAISVDGDMKITAHFKEEDDEPSEPVEEWTFAGHDRAVHAVAVDEDGYVYSGSWDSTVRKIDPDGDEVWSFDEHDYTVKAVAVDEDGYVYSGSRDSTVRKIDPDGDEVWIFDGHVDYVHGVAVDKDGYVYSGVRDNTVRKIGQE